MNYYILVRCKSKINPKKLDKDIWKVGVEEGTYSKVQPGTTVYVKCSKEHWLYEESCMVVDKIREANANINAYVHRFPISIDTTAPLWDEERLGKCFITGETSPPIPTAKGGLNIREETDVSQSITIKHKENGESKMSKCQELIRLWKIKNVDHVYNIVDIKVEEVKELDENVMTLKKTLLRINNGDDEKIVDAHSFFNRKAAISFTVETIETIEAVRQLIEDRDLKVKQIENKEKELLAITSICETFEQQREVLLVQNIIDLNFNIIV